jgi:hypothetical protein
MKNDIKKNILLDTDEKIYKEFPKLKGLGHFCNDQKTYYFYRRVQGNKVPKN